MADQPGPVIVLLRGINVGGKNKLPMADLREIAAECGYPDAVTYIQSGNLVLAPTSDTPEDISTALASAIADRTGLTIAVIVRTAEQWREIIAENPFPDAVEGGKQLHAIVLDGPAPDALVDFDDAPFEPERVAVLGSTVYMWLPNGMGRSKLAEKVARLPGASTGTARNWNTVLKLAALTEE